MSTESNVTSIGKPPARLLPDMQIRWLMSNMDKVEEIAFVLRLKGENPMVSVSSNCSQYFLSLASAILNREALKGITNENGPYKDGPKEK